MSAFAASSVPSGLLDQPLLTTVCGSVSVLEFLNLNQINMLSRIGSFTSKKSVCAVICRHGGGGGRPGGRPGK